jgi:hypothetical protein
MNEPLMRALVAVAARCAERDVPPTPRDTRAIAEEVARERALGRRDAEALRDAAESYAASVCAELLGEEASERRAPDDPCPRAAGSCEVRPPCDTRALSQRLLPPPWRARELGGQRRALRGARPWGRMPWGRMKKHRILFLAGNAYQVDPIAFSEEYAAIHAQLRAARPGDEFGMVPLLEFCIGALEHHLIAYDPAVVHISGRGGSDGSLVFQDAQQRPEPVSARALVGLLRNASPNVRLIVLNGCYSRARAEWLRTEVDCVVGTDERMADGEARAFVRQLYRALGEGLSVGEATAQGTAAIAPGCVADDVRPRCLTRDGIDAYQVVFRPSRSTPDAFAGLSEDPLQAVAATGAAARDGAGGATASASMVSERYRSLTQAQSAHRDMAPHKVLWSWEDDCLVLPATAARAHRAACAALLDVDCDRR